GQTPYAAMELRFIDPIGLVDTVIARLRHQDYASPFHHQPSPSVRAQIRDHLFALAPRLVAFVAYIPRAYVQDVRERFVTNASARDREALFAGFVDLNPYHVGLHADE